MIFKAFVNYVGLSLILVGLSLIFIGINSIQCDINYGDRKDDD